MVGTAVRFIGSYAIEKLADYAVDFAVDLAEAGVTWLYQQALYEINQFTASQR